jgi:antitoxin (DNA-binding transcriptional repressor) of toxin-antitoxin stability system
MKKTIQIIDIRKAGRQLSKLADRAAKGEPFVIAKDGKPLVKIAAIDEPTSTRVRRLGFMVGQISVPDDFDQMGRFEIE